MIKCMDQGKGADRYWDCWKVRLLEDGAAGRWGCWKVGPVRFSM